MIFVPVPGSKSATHRALILAARAPGQSKRIGASMSEDCHATREALRRMGATIACDAATGVDVVTGGILCPPAGPLDCGNSGTTLRLIAATAATLDGQTLLTGEATLLRRPMNELCAQLREHGAQVDWTDRGLQITGPISSKKRSEWNLAGAQTTQFATALMLALPFVADASRVRLQLPPYAPGYLEMTIAIAKQFGVTASLTDTIPGSQRAQATTLNIEPDWASAAFPLAAGALLGHAINIPELPTSTHQPDSKMTALLAQFGVASKTGDGFAIAGGVTESPHRVDVTNAPDLFPIAVVLAASRFAQSARTRRTKCTVVGGTVLQFKESNRIIAMASALQQLGVRCTYDDGSISLTGGRLVGATVDGCDDHRVQMALHVLALIVPNLRVRGADRTSVSFPGFHAAIDQVRAFAPNQLTEVAT